MGMGRGPTPIAMTDDSATSSGIHSERSGTLMRSLVYAPAVDRLDLALSDSADGLLAQALTELGAHSGKPCRDHSLVVPFVRVGPAAD